MPTFKSTATLGAACALTAVLAACTSNSPAASSPVASSPAATVPVTTTQPATPSASSSPAATPPAATPPDAATPVAVAPVATSPGPGTLATGCATREGSLPGSSITVCPDAAPVGGVVHVTVKGCAPAAPAAALVFLGPGSWLGTDGGGGANVTFYPRTGSAEAAATFTIPATYTGGNENEKGGNYPTLTVKPGTSYDFVTDPAGGCNVPFTVTAG